MYEGSLCVCCMSTDDLVQLFVTENDEGDGSENYAKMLAVCLRIPVSETDGHDSICGGCVDKLKDCLHFKKQTLQSISILSSVKLSEIVTVEDLRILGLTKPDRSSHPGARAVEEPAAAAHCGAKLAENKKKRKAIQVEESNCDSEVIAVDYNEAIDKASRVPKSSKRRVGRPRQHSPGGLPYRVEPHELTCRECGRCFPTHITLKVHYNSHFGRHACASCGARFVARSSLRKHERAHDAGPFRCGVCQKEFRKVNTLLSHKRYKHGAAPPYRCAQCGARFSTLHRRLRHLAAAHAPAPRRHACPHCDARFRTSSERAKHVRTHHEVKLTSCAQCGARLRLASLAAHMRAHTRTHSAPRAPLAYRERRFSCRLCGAAFAQKHSLLYHIGAHARRGLYAGEPAALVADSRHDSRADTGLLSDVDEDVNEETQEQHLDESALDDDARARCGATHAHSAPSSAIDEADIAALADMDEEGVHELCANLGFTDFDE